MYRIIVFALLFGCAIEGSEDMARGDMISGGAGVSQLGRDPIKPDRLRSGGSGGGGTARRGPGGFVIDLVKPRPEVDSLEGGAFPGVPRALPPVTPPAIAPLSPQEKELRTQARRRQGLRQTLLTGGQGVSSTPVAKTTLLGS